MKNSSEDIIVQLKREKSLLELRVQTLEEKKPNFAMQNDSNGSRPFPHLDSNRILHYLLHLLFLSLSLSLSLTHSLSSSLLSLFRD